ncbi:MAG TPA: CpsB/CapC family capsule biosynthesis tyrosine phosphatase [Thermodesulfobacteriota bacterium]
MIDIHCHLLPFVDDGPRTWNESIELARMLSEEGVEIAISTPHWIKGSKWAPESNRIEEMVSELNERLEKKNITLKVLPGMEVGITEDLLELVNNGKVLTLAGGSFLLLETPFMSIPYGIEELIYSLKCSGIDPIFAHPERCHEVQLNPQRLKEIIDLGALVQVTASSFLGYFGDEAKECATNLARSGLVHFFASDAHSPNNRPPIINKAILTLNRILGEEETSLIKEGATQIIPHDLNIT